jgi:pimeloyl-ACP methyl ester carboxylesterase
MQDIRFDLAHLSLAGITNGNVGKPVLLALHGWLDNAASFEEMMPYFGSYHVIAIDFPGHGLSPHRSIDAHYHFVEWVYDISQLILQQQWEAVTIVGHSMGGMVGSVLASVLPEKVARIVLIDSIGLITTEPDKTCEQLRNAIFSRAKVGLKKKAVHSSVESALQARVFAGDLKEKEARVLLKRGLMAVQGGYTWRSDQRLRTHSALRATLEQALNYISNIQCPVLMIHGRDGAKMVKQNMTVYSEHFADLRCIEMPGGHHCHMEYPQQAAQLVNDFIIVP